jgi:uncharacterized protein (DUF885 family)
MPCESDVDRYCVLPGMIAGDEVGFYGWREAREAARRTRRHAFDLASFHDEGLENGALPQSALLLAISVTRSS